MLFAHGDLITELIMLSLEPLRGVADDAGTVVGVLLKLVGVLILLPGVVLVLDFACGIMTAIFIRKKRWLFLVITAEAIILYAVFCVPAGTQLLADWNPFWAWLTIGVGGLVSIVAGLLNSLLIVGMVALAARMFRKDAASPPSAPDQTGVDANSVARAKGVE